MKNKKSGFFNDIKEGWKIFKDSINFMLKKPAFLIPLFFSWIVVAIVVLYNRYYFPDLGGFWLDVAYLYLLIIIIAISISLANLLMLELIEQMESGKNISFSKALKETINFDLIRLIPLALIWGVVWLIIVILRSLIRRGKDSDNPEPSVEDAAQTLSGMNSPFSLGGLGLNMLEKLIRMVVFMALPAIAWENKGSFEAFKIAFQKIKKHPKHFLTSYSLTFAAGAFMALPLIPIYILSKLEVTLPPFVWVIVLIYSGIIWTLEVYLEQMSVGILYMWDLKWMKSGGKGKISSVEKPDLFDDIYELKKDIE